MSLIGHVSIALLSRTARKVNVTTSCVLRQNLNVRYGWKQLHRPGTFVAALLYLDFNEAVI